MNENKNKELMSKLYKSSINKFKNILENKRYRYIFIFCDFCKECKNKDKDEDPNCKECLINKNICDHHGLSGTLGEIGDKYHSDNYTILEMDLLIKKIINELNIELNKYK